MASQKHFLERSIGSLAGALEHAALAESSSEQPGLLQSLDPRTKVIALPAMIVVAASAPRVGATSAVLALAVLLALCSRIPLRVFTTRVWPGALLFTGFIAFPSVFLTPGEPLAHLPGLHWTVTGQGLHTALRLIARAGTAATLACLLVLSTPWTHLLKALRVFRVPAVPVVILGMTHRYIFLLLHGALNLFEARRCRLVGPLSVTAHRRLAAANAGVLLEKSLLLSEDVYAAMQARGFCGEVYTLDEFRMKPRDWLALALAALVCGALLIMK